jgi:hypothetical protein
MNGDTPFNNTFQLFTFEQDTQFHQLFQRLSSGYVSGERVVSDFFAGKGAGKD